MAVVTTEMAFGCKLVEEVAAPFGAVNTFDYSLPDLLMRGGAGTSPVVSEVWSGTFTLVAGAVTVSLAALTRTGRTSLDLTNKRVLGFRIDNLGTASITLATGATTGYVIGDGIVVGPGGSAQVWHPTGFGTVTASLFNIDAAGTGTDSFRLAIWAGTV